jgi:hypothetical protein
MVHSGYEASAVNDTFSSLRGVWDTARASLSRYRDPGALRLLDEPVQPVHAINPLVQLHTETPRGVPGAPAFGALGCKEAHR